MAEETQQKKRKKHRFFWLMIKLQILLLLAFLGCIGFYYFGGYAEQVNALHSEAVRKIAASSEKDFVPSQTSLVYDTNGILISERSGEKNAEYIVYEDIPAPFVAAIISIEDKKYYKHHGVDFAAVIRAAKAMIVDGKITQGGSTLTMQLAKLIYMDQPAKTWQYKVEQMFMALELEKRYTKSKIMEYYLNNIYFANGYYGIAAASHGYFDCEPNELDISQVTFLLAIPNSPSYYDPLVNFEHTIKRRNLILRNLWEDGRLSDESYYAAISEKITLNQRPRSSGLWNNYVDTFVYRCATMAMMENRGFTFRYYFNSDEEEAEYDQEYDELYADCQKQLYTGGYKIYTSIDMHMQKLLQDTMDEQLLEFDEVNEDGIYCLQGAAVCIDNRNGYVVAIAGGRDQDVSNYTLNRAYQSHRQPGSSIKPLIVYTPCFERGYYPDTIVVDEELENGPANSNDKYYGEVEIRKAVAKSLNTIAWKLYEELTPRVGLQYLKNMNFSAIKDTDYVLATALGGFTQGVSPLEMAAGFATIQNDGLYRDPTCIKTIVDADDNIVYISQQYESVIYSETAARMMTNALQEVMTTGTAKELSLAEMPCAGKTGTTNSNKDGWFVGYTRYYTTSVWVGCDQPKEVENLKGSTYPGWIWQSFMEKVHEGLSPLEFLPYAKLSEEFWQAQEEERQRHDHSFADEPPDGENAEDGEAVADGENVADGEAAADGEAVADGENAEDGGNAETGEATAEGGNVETGEATADGGNVETGEAAADGGNVETGEVTADGGNVETGEATADGENAADEERRVDGENPEDDAGNPGDAEQTDGNSDELTIDNEE